MKVIEFLMYTVLAIVLSFVGLWAGMSVAKAETTEVAVKIAVIDTGFNTKYKDKVNLCRENHASFVKDFSLIDSNGHGTNIAGLIAQQTDKDYCLLILKYYEPGANNLGNSVKAINYAIEHDVDIINYSGGGVNPSTSEKRAIVKALDKGILVVAAAGNEATNLNTGSYYPAMYDKRAIVVGNLNEKGYRAPSSNYGEVVDVMVGGSNKTALGLTMTGTSQSTAIATGKIVNQLHLRKVLKQQIELFGSVSTDNYVFEYEYYMAQ